VLLSITMPPGTGGAVEAAPLHAPDGFFSGPVLAVTWAISIVAVAIALRMTGRQLNERMVPALGVFAAFIFAAQMINFPVAGGTSGHLVGGALAAIVLGPWAAVLVVTAVVVLQALVFQDGGLVAMGANILNMAVVSSLVGYAVFRMGGRMSAVSPRLLVMGFIAAWVSVEAAALTTTLQLGASGTTSLGVALPAMLGIHALIGIGEGLITVGALAVIRASRRDLLQTATSSA
jgi:cobalt/nickel transport system permease protein